MGTLIWLVLLTAALLTLAYRRTDLKTSTIVLGALLVAYLLFGDGGFLWNTLLLALFVLFALLNVEVDSPRQRHAPPVRHLPPHAAEHVEDRAGSARSRQRLVGRRALHGHAGLAPAQEPAAAEADGRGASVPRRPDRGALPAARRLADHARARRLAAERLAVPQGEQVLRDDHPEGVRRVAVLAARELDGAREARRRAAPSRRRRSACRTRSGPPSSCCITAPTSRSSTGCRGSRAAKRCRASR